MALNSSQEGCASINGTEDCDPLVSRAPVCASDTHKYFTQYFNQTIYSVVVKIFIGLALSWQQVRVLNDTQLVFVS